MTINEINLPKWVIMEVCKMYPNVSSQTAIKRYLVSQLNSRDSRYVNGSKNNSSQSVQHQQ